MLSSTSRRKKGACLGVFVAGIMACASFAAADTVTAADASGNNHVMNFVGTGVSNGFSTTDFKFGGSAAFQTARNTPEAYVYADGSTAFYTDVFSTGFTVEGWFKITGTQNETTNTVGLLSLNSGSWLDATGGAGMSNKIRFVLPARRLSDGALKYLEVSSTVTLADISNQWVHLAGTFDAETQVASLYINGSLIGSTAAAPGVYGPHAAWGEDADVNVLYTGGSYRAAFGLVDEIRISNTVRYSGNFTPAANEFASDGSTVALWHFNEGAVPEPATSMLMVSAGIALYMRQHNRR